MAANPEPKYVEIAMDHEWSTLLRLARATMAVDQLGEVQSFPHLHLAGALDALKAEFVKAHETRREAEERT